MKPFDLEAARRGDPIEVRMDCDTWERREFIGTFYGPIGLMIVYVESNHPEFTVLAGVRMAKKERTVYVTLLRGGGAYWNDMPPRVVEEGSALAIAVPVTFEE